MKSGRSNKFSRAIGHLKSTTIDEKLQLQLLSEIPTNNTQGVYTDEPERTVTTTLNPNLNPVDLTVGDTYATRRDTSGLFMPDGTILTEEPPGDTSYILGPMAAMYYTWSYPWTMIGYIRQSDRKMVNLGFIDGKLSDWDGSVGGATSGSGTFRSYGQITLSKHFGLGMYKSRLVQLTIQQHTIITLSIQVLHHKLLMRLVDIPVL